MARVKSSVTILLPASKVWTAVADVPKWVLYVPDARKKGWGDSWEAPKELGQGKVIRMVAAKKALLQNWQLVAWKPGEGLRAESREAYGLLYPMATAFEVAIKPVSDAETKLESSCETRFTRWALPLNLIVPLRRDMELMLTRWEQGIVAALGG